MKLYWNIYIYIQTNIKLSFVVALFHCIFSNCFGTNSFGLRTTKFFMMVVRRTSGSPNFSLALIRSQRDFCYYRLVFSLRAPSLNNAVYVNSVSQALVTSAWTPPKIEGQFYRAFLGRFSVSFFFLEPPKLILYIYILF